jgi:hypothetical protein
VYNANGSDEAPFICTSRSRTFQVYIVTTLMSHCSARISLQDFTCCALFAITCSCPTNHRPLPWTRNRDRASWPRRSCLLFRRSDTSDPKLMSIWISVSSSMKPPTAPVQYWLGRETSRTMMFLANTQSYRGTSHNITKADEFDDDFTAMEAASFPSRTTSDAT